MLTTLKNKWAACTIVLLFFCTIASAQTEVPTVTTDSIRICPPQTIFDIFKKKDSLLVVKPAKNNFFLIIPVIGSQPATGFMFGGVAQYTFKGKGEADKYSIVNLGVTYTTKDQLLINMKNNVLLNNNKIFLSGDWRFYIFSQPNYGLGTNIIPRRPEDTFSIDSIAEPMNYNYLKFHQAASWLVSENFYIGAGINLDWYSSIDDNDLNIEAGQLTHHYNYSQKYEFNNLEYFVNGVSFNVVYDSRDNQINAYKGWFANINYRINPSIFDNQHNSNVLYAEYRGFLPMGKKKNHILALWGYGQFVTRGRLPYLNLPAIGWDQRSRGGEGYTQGLFRGFNLVYLSAEYRFPITCNQVLGGVVSTNFTTTSNKDQDIRLFQYVQPAVGLGLRICIDKATRTNLVVDYAVGRQSSGFYLNAGETF